MIRLEEADKSCFLKNVFLENDSYPDPQSVLTEGQSRY